MLKRFMTWLLNQLQKIASAVGDKRGKGHKRTLSTRELDPRERDPFVPATESEGTEVSVAERVSYTPPVAELPSERPEARSSESAAVDPKNDALRDSSASAQAIEISAGEIGIRNRLDAASSSVSGIPEEKPSFPTEVSALLSIDEQAIDDAAALAVHPSGAVSDEQLPVIQDLLPAIPSSEEGISAANQGNAAEQSRASNDESASEAETDRESASDKAVEGEALVSQELAVEDAMLPQESAIATDVDEPIVFTFDIVESEDGNSSEEEGAAAVDESAIVLPEREPESTDAGASEPIESSLVESADSVEPLPYPWSIANSPNTDKANTNQRGSERASENFSGIVEIEVSSEKADGTSVSNPLPAESSQKKTAAESQPVKQGTVKLLFTMKKGNFHGYIAPDDGSKDILFHQKYINADIFSQLERGAQVSATVKYIEGKAYATHVDLQK